MTDLVHVEKVNEVFVRVVTEPSIKMEMSDHFTFEVPGAKFMPSVRNKVWDGRVRLLNTMTGYIYAGLVPYIKKFCDQRGYDCQVSKELGETEAVPDDFGYDLAKQVDAAFEVRDYQNDAIVHAIRHNRALFLSPTASGKSFIIYLIMAHHLMLDRKILIVVPTTSLVDQMASDFIEYNKGKKLDIHKIRGGVDKEPKRYTFTLENGNKYRFEGNESIKLINSNIKAAKDITSHDEIDDRWISSQSSKQIL
jgi:CRISPR/Cas system-associated endonuclease/helicase Cas3